MEKEKWDIRQNIVVYKDEYYTLGLENEYPYLIANGKKYTFTCHPFEPCLYITGEDGFKTALHNSFEPYALLECFYKGRPVTSVTGRKYTALDFCRLAQYSAGKGDISIDDAEKALYEEKQTEKRGGTNKNYTPAAESRPGVSEINISDGCFPDDKIYSVLEEYPDCVVDFLIVKTDRTLTGGEAHRYVLTLACHRLFDDECEGDGWYYDAGKAEGSKISAKELFAHANENGKLNYRAAFLHPPYGTGYSDADFDRINAALFPAGTESLEVYEWSTDWSDYFDDGQEWWGALCLTVYDRALDRFVIILASATD